jgi:hypothetical protein
VQKPPFVDQNTWLLHSFPEFGKKWNDISKTDTYICKKNHRHTPILLEGKLKKTEKKHQTWRDLILMAKWELSEV